jgi:hypothetical protein
MRRCFEKRNPDSMPRQCCLCYVVVKIARCSMHATKCCGDDLSAIRIGEQMRATITLALHGMSNWTNKNT